MEQLVLLAVSSAAGFLGALLGIGGGMIVVPALTLGLKIDIRYAIAASLLSIVATSSGAAASFLRDHLTNLRLAVLLEVGTVLGAITGFLISKKIDSSHLYALFGGFLLFSAAMMFRKKGDNICTDGHPWAKRLNMNARLLDKSGAWVAYEIANVPVGLLMMYFAGILSALLGIGSGILKVMAMDQAMRLPMKVSSATSNFMIGVTATASAGAYFLNGDLRSEIACPVSLGIIVGAWGGAKVMPKMPADLIRKIFVGVLVFVSVQMIVKGIRG